MLTIDVQVVGKDGEPKPNYEPGYDLKAKVTVICDGVRGNLTKEVVRRLGLEGENPQTYETGVKEIWRVDPAKHRQGTVIHTVFQKASTIVSLSMRLR